MIRTVILALAAFLAGHGGWSNSTITLSVSMILIIIVVISREE
ncbi:MAG: hypothetical protein AAB478_00090 [Patescibacteria group bacterium]